MSGFKSKSSASILGSLALIALLFMPAAALAEGGLTKVADKVYAYVDVKDSGPGNSFGANAGVIVTDEGLIVVDTLISSKAAKKFIEDIKAVSDKPVRYVINTHYHLDHTFGNAEFAVMGAEIVAHGNCRKDLLAHGGEVFKNLGMYGLTEEDMVGTELRYPDIVFDDTMAIYLGGQEVELTYLGHTHSDDSIVVYLPQQKLLFAGDALFTGYHVFLAEGDLTQWDKALDEILAMDVQAIIPGHGPVSNKDDVRRMKEYLSVFDTKAKELAASGAGVEEAAAEIEKLLPRAEGKWLINANLQIKYMAGGQ